MQSPKTSSVPIISEFAADPDMRELVEFFVSALPERVDALNAAFREQRLRDLQRLAHQMKGAAGGYGFPTVGAAAGALEATLKESEAPSLDHVQAQLGDLIQLCTRATTGAH